MTGAQRGSGRPTAPPADHLEYDQLGRLGSELGKGGQAIVYELPDLRLPDVTGPLVYKEYKAQQTPPSGLSSVVAVRNRLDPTRRSRLDEIAAWPNRIVTEHGVVRGVVMPRIPDSFFDEVVLPGTGDRKKTPREVQHLFIEPERARWLGRPTPSPEQRLAVCRDFAATLAFLHDELNVVFGDVNAKNELFRLNTEPMVMLVDCDAVRIAGNVAVVRQLNAPDWEPPEPGPLSRATDLYKLGLFILRCLTLGNHASLRRDPTAAAQVFDVAGLALLTSAIKGKPNERPTASQWYVYLCRSLGQPLDPPRLRSVDLDRTVVASGKPVSVRWVAEDATTVEVTAPEGVIARADATSGSGSVPVHLVRSGALQVTVRNELGTDQHTIGPVAVVDLPATQTLPVPVPRFEWPDHGTAVLSRFDVAELPAISSDIGLPLAAQMIVPLSAEQPTAPLPPPPALEMFGESPGLDACDAGCPVDVVSIMTSGPSFDIVSSTRGEVVR